MKNIVIVYKDFKQTSKIADAVAEIGENLFLTTSMKNGLQFLNFERADIFIVDSSYDISQEEFEALKKVESEIIFISNDRDRLKLDLNSIGNVVTYDEMLEYINRSKKDIGANIPNINKKKKPNVFRDIESFKSSITQEVRRAKRYRYPLVVVMFKLSDKKYIEQVVNYFISKIREFDSLWIIDDDRFAMVLPHTGWNGAEILTNRLTNHIAEELNIDVSFLKNKIITFQRIESDADFTKKIEDGLDGKYYDISRKIDFDAWKEALFSEFIERKTVRIFNRYKGMLISHDSDIVLNDARLEVYNIRPIQLTIINNEKVVYFYSSTLNKTIRAGADEIDIERAFATLTSFEIIDSSFIKNTKMKLIIDEDIFVKVSSGKDIVKSKLIELSLDEITIETNSIDIFKNSESYEVEFPLKLKDGKIHLIKGKVTLKELEEGKDISYVDLEFTTSSDGNMNISAYLSDKQMKLIKELKDKASKN